MTPPSGRRPMDNERLPDFVCAICQRNVDMRWAGFRVRKDTPLAPFCVYCEQQYSAGIGQTQHGSFRDRREVKRGFAIAEALHCAAMQQKWSGHVIA